MNRMQARSSDPNLHRQRTTYDKTYTLVNE
jgi:hypothetical protein